MTISIHQRPLEERRTPENSCTWVAETEIAGQSFAARSRRGAPQELARALAAAGVPDQPVRVESAGLRGEMRYPSLHRMAGMTYVEGRSTLLQRARYREDERFAIAGEGAAEPIGLPSVTHPEAPESGISPSDGSLAIPEPEPRCGSCGEAFVPSRSWATFCSAACRQKAYRQRLSTVGSRT
jgi:hypothetical protein